MNSNLYEVIEKIEELERCSLQWYDGRIVKKPINSQVTGLAKKIINSISIPARTRTKLIKCKALHNGSCEIELKLDRDSLSIKIDPTIELVSFDLLLGQSGLNLPPMSGLNFPFGAVDECLIMLNEILSDRNV
jgi:hypothetical protein